MRSLPGYLKRLHVPGLNSAGHGSVDGVAQGPGEGPLCRLDGKSGCTSIFCSELERGRTQIGCNPEFVRPEPAMRFCNGVLKQNLASESPAGPIAVQAASFGRNSWLVKGCRSHCAGLCHFFKIADSVFRCEQVAIFRPEVQQRGLVRYRDPVEHGIRHNTDIEVSGNSVDAECPERSRWSCRRSRSACTALSAVGKLNPACHEHAGMPLVHHRFVGRRSGSRYLECLRRPPGSWCHLGSPWPRSRRIPDVFWT